MILQKCASIKYRMHMQKLLIIVGPTASGKSALGVELARRFDGEVISADSRQVYRGLDIGTGKVTKLEMKGIRHHLLDVVSPKKLYGAAEYAKAAKKACEEVRARGHLPIVVGGTGYFIDALTGRIVLPDVPPDEALRRRLSGRSVAQLFELLQLKDPARAATIEPHNKRRLIRALEIAEALGRVPMVDLRGRSPLFNALWIGIKPSDEHLAEKISTRLEARVRRGMVAEAKRLHAGGLSYGRMEELGLEYRSLARHLKGLISKDEMVEELARDIRRYAKKQMVYWKRNADITWYSPAQQKEMIEAVRVWLQR